jgi:hypothetical protein
MNPQEISLRHKAPCQCMRSKEMYHQPVGLEEDDFASGIFWCTKTHENFGPDGEPVGKQECGPGRSCFRG